MNPVYLGILGAPGSGKGTYGVKIARDLDVLHVSTGDMLRQSVQANEPLGQKAKSFMTSGKLVPDELMIELVQSRITKSDATGGFLLDGFPRTLPQAEKLDQLGPKLNWVLLLDVPDEICIRRLSGRRHCSQCGRTYNLYSELRPQEGELCDVCKILLTMRPDDDLSTVTKRLNVYKELTAPLEDYYAKSHRLLKANGVGPTAEAIYKGVIALLQSRVPAKR